MWMQAWNIYLTVTLTHNPARALGLVGYQRIITSANHSLPLKAWIQYDGQFWTPAASNPHFCWDQHHPELWYEAMATANTQRDTKWWPCSYCGAKNHFLDNRLAHPFVTACNTLDHLIAEHPVLQHVGILTIVSAHKMHAPSSTFSCPAKAPIPMSPVQTGDQPTKTSEVQFGPGWSSPSGVTKPSIDPCFH